MSVNKPYGYPGGPISPITRSSKAPSPSKPLNNAEPSTPRGMRRKKKTAEYEENCEQRRSQRYKKRV